MSMLCRSSINKYMIMVKKNSILSKKLSCATHGSVTSKLNSGYIICDACKHSRMSSIVEFENFPMGRVHNIVGE